MTASTTFKSRGVTATRIAILFLAVVAIYIFRDTWLPTGSSYKSQPASIEPIQHTEPEQGTQYEDIKQTASESCFDAPGADNVLVMLKTGATELYQKLPTHFVTTFTCVPHFMIFSDLAQNFADYPIHDAIAPVSKHFREHHEDFELYRKLQQYQAEGQDMSKLKGDGGWNLDKWKFLPMLHQAFESAGDNIEWFILMEADTSVSWTNLLQWLKTMDHTKPYYLGAQNVIGDTTFAHGGSGVVMSRKAADLLVQNRRRIGKVGYDEMWEERTSTSCCGDEIIARAFMEVNVPLTPAWPLIQGETVSSVDWKEEHWCTPAVTWHHVQPIEVDAMFQFQSDWVDDHGWDTPYLFRDVFAHFIERHITVNRTSWNNLSQDKRFVSSALSATDDTLGFDKLQPFEQKAVESQDACAEACMQHEECVQWMFSPGRCYIGEVVRFGRSDEREVLDEHWTSGWVHERIEAFARKFEGCKVKWAGA
ncbi:hypothetical protein LTR85_008984 [Meristemomyces frigidus]|nr:hypothetical protein LTR85_008984 [Meristemomyces frigidus]